MSKRNGQQELTLALNYPHFQHGKTVGLLADCFEWMERIPEESIHAVVTDPPYGVKEYEADELRKREAGRGGIWRIPPKFDGCQRAPLPRFTALDEEERAVLARFFENWSKHVTRVLKPGGHVMIACNAFMSQLVYTSLVQGGLEFRGEIIRLVRTLRGGDRPKNAEKEFPDACSMPRGCYEPWGLFRKPFKGTVADCLRKHWTGALRRLPDGNPFCDVITSERTPAAERDLTGHPSVKPQSLMRQLVYASLPLGKGIVLDTFMGSGSTLAAAEALGYEALGVERMKDYYDLARRAIPKLAVTQIDRLESIPSEEEGVQLLFDIKS